MASFFAPSPVAVTVSASASAALVLVLHAGLDLGPLLLQERTPDERRASTIAASAAPQTTPTSHRLLPHLH
ncbi:MAG: hypothetical protein KIS78_10675 [Labilithrix sp.]|nr:hypothetical protein [Labilithrix sp.]